MQLKKYLLPALLVCVISSLTAQDLLSDGRNLLRALQTMSNPVVSAQVRDSASLEALLILYLYDEPTQITTPNQVQPERILGHLKSNSLLHDLVQTKYDSMFRLLTPPPSWEKDWSRLQTPGRAKISELLYGNAPRTPSEYLSVRRSLVESQLPPLQDAASIRGAADKVSKAQPTTALAGAELLETLFEFILERAKQEVVIAFFENLLDKKVPQVELLFPNVHEQYSGATVNYSQSFLANLRTAFFLDLQNLNLTLPELFLNDDYFGALQEDPIFYNLMTVYSMYGLSLQGDVPMSEVIPITHNQLYGRYNSASVIRNTQLADTAFSSDEYKQLTVDALNFVDGVVNVWNKLYTQKRDVGNKVKRLRIKFPTPKPPKLSDYLIKPLYDLNVLLGNADTSSAFDLHMLPYLLEGSFDRVLFKNYNTIAHYDQFFNPPHTPQELRIAGLQLTRNLTGAWYNDLGLLEILRYWQADLMAYEAAIDQWRDAIDTLNLQQQMVATTMELQAQAELIVDMQKFWKGKAKSSDVLPLFQLEAIANAGFSQSDYMANETTLDSLKGRRGKLAQIQERLIALESRLNPDLIESPLHQYLNAEKQPRPSALLSKSIDSLEQKLQAVRVSLKALDLKYAHHEHKVIENVTPMLQVTELISQLFFVLRSGDDWLSKKSLDTIFADPKLKQACMGLMQLRISKINGLNTISSDAVGKFASLTLEDLWTIRAAEADTSTEKNAKYLKLYKIVTAALETLNRTLEIPLFADPAKPRAFVSLATLNPKLAPIPVISKRCMDLLYYLEIGDHKSAIGALMRLMTSVTDVISKNNPSKKRAKLLSFFDEYGDFIAGLVDAKTKQEAEYLLNTLANKPGTSRAKRTDKQNLSLNAYLGASAGMDTWNRGENDASLETDFESLAPSIPIGFSYSFLVGKRPKHRQSFSVTLSVLDLGAMMTYRTGDQSAFGTEKLNFKNVLKPGIQLQWNIQQTPFYIGAGWQTGAQYRMENDQEISFRSSRSFVAFGIDVPFKTLWQR